MSAEKSSPDRCPNCGLEREPEAAGEVCPRCAFVRALATTVGEQEAEFLSLHDIPPPGQKVAYVGDYELLEVIAHGGMGVVYKARQRRPQRIVALKMLLGGTHASEDFKRRFTQEAETVARLQHPNIVPIYEVGQHDGQPYFSMEYVEGSDLGRMVRTRPLPPPSAARYVMTVATAVQYAHEQGIVHRDLKPSNILVGMDGRPRITDFGLAREEGKDSGLTLTGQMLGTPGYLPPEQISAKSGVIGPHSDVYALGAVLYHLLTGRPPFLAGTVADTLAQVRETEALSPCQLNPATPRDLATLCLKCLEKSAARRYGSAQALADDLGRWLRGEPILARPVSSWERAGKWVRRHPVTAGLSAAVAVSLVLGLSGVTWQWRRAEHQRAVTAAVNARLQLQRAEDALGSDRPLDGLPILARVLRDDPLNRVAAERLMNLLGQRRFLIPSEPVSNRPTFGDPQRTFREASARDGTCIAWVTNQTSIDLRPAPISTVIHIEAAHSKVIRSLSLRSNGAQLVSASEDQTARLWNAEKGTLLVTLPHPAAVLFAEFSPDGSSVATACADGQARLFATGDGRVLARFPAQRASLVVVRFSPDGLVLAVGGEEKVVRLWRVQNQEPLCEPLTLANAVDDLRFTADGRQLFIRLEGGEILCLSLTQPSGLTSGAAAPPIPAATIAPVELVMGRPATNFHTAPITSTRLSPDGLKAATASADRTARVWDTRSHRPLTEGLVHRAVVNGVCFSPDGQRIATSDSDGRLRVWDAATGAPLTDWIQCERGVAGVGFSADGRKVVASNGQAWEIFVASAAAPDWLAEIAENIAGEEINSEQLIEKVPAREFHELITRLTVNREWSGPFVVVRERLGFLNRSHPVTP